MPRKKNFKKKERNRKRRQREKKKKEKEEEGPIPKFYEHSLLGPMS
jgi:hypothetical protein